MERPADRPTEERDQSTTEREDYLPPAFHSQQPLDVMSAWVDRSSELEF